MADWEFEPARDLGMQHGERMRSLSRERGLFDHVVGGVWWSTVWLYMKLWHRIRVEGRENIPKEPPFVLVANHSSHLDTLALATAVPRAVRSNVFPIAAGDHFFNSTAKASFAAFVLNALPMWRRSAGSHALTQLRERLIGDPCAFILFPEGTRSRTGEMGPFRAGLGMLVAETDVPVVPCHLEGCFAALPSSGKFPRPKKLHLQIGAPERFADIKSNKEGWRTIADRTEGRVKELRRG